MLGGKNKQQSQSLGYTIIELMIVLAISSFMFVIAANFINGKQEKAAFTQGSNDMVSKLQNVVEDVTDGHYSDVPLQCSISGSVLTVTTSGTGEQGHTPDCVFLGKIVRFYDPGGGSNRNNYSVYSIAAARSITTFPNDLVAAVSGSPPLTANTTVPQNLTVKSMSVTPLSGPPIGNVFNIGFVQSLGKIDGAAGVYLSGNQQPVQLAYANTTSGSESSITGTVVQRAKSATICVTDGTRYADIFIGGATTAASADSNNNNQLNISVQQLGTNSCAS